MYVQHARGAAVVHLLLHKSGESHHMYIVRDQLHCYAASFAACAAALLLLLCCVAAGATKCHCAELKEGTVRSREPSKNLLLELGSHRAGSLQT
jgi:hypothetical protein